MVKLREILEAKKNADFRVVQQLVEQWQLDRGFSLVMGIMPEPAMRYIEALEEKIEQLEKQVRDERETNP